MPEGLLTRRNRISANDSVCLMAVGEENPRASSTQRGLRKKRYILLILSGQRAGRGS